MRLLFSLASVVLLALFSGCQRLPSEEWGRLTAERRELVASPAAPFASLELAQFEKQFQELQVEYRRAANQLPIFRDELLEVRIRDLAAWSQALREQGQLRRAVVFERLADQLEDLQARLDEVDLRRLTPKGRTALTRAEVAFNLARKKFEGGDSEATAAAIEEFLLRYATLEHMIKSSQDRFQDRVLLDLWEQWRRRLIARSRVDASPALLVDKKARRADLIRAGKVVASFPVDLGWNPLDDKQRQGDGATPEGEYKVLKKKQGSQTRYYLALLLDYPNRRDREMFRIAKEIGEVESDATPGGLIEVHGFGGQEKDWTDGCVALEDRDMDRLFKVAYVGMPVTIVGTVKE